MANCAGVEVDIFDRLKGCCNAFVEQKAAEIPADCPRLFLDYSEGPGRFSVLRGAFGKPFDRKVSFVMSDGNRIRVSNEEQGKSEESLLYSVGTAGDVTLLGFDVAQGTLLEFAVDRCKWLCGFRPS